MNSHLEVKKLSLTLRSPVHVGSRFRQHTPMDAVALGNRIYKVSEMKLAVALQKEHLLDDFVVRAGRDGAGFDLRAYLEQKRLLTATFLAGVTEFQTLAPQGVAPALLATFRPCIRGGLGQAYLPGTSLKGAIRTALLNGVIGGMDEAGRGRIADGVSDQIVRRAKREWFGQPVVGRLLQGSLPLGRRKPEGVTPQHRELLRCLKVSDALYAGETAVLPVKILSLREGDGQFYLKDQMLLESIPAGARLTCTLTLDRGLLAEFGKQGPPPFTDLAGLLAQVQAFANGVLDEEFAFYDGLTGAGPLLDFYNRTDANLRLGLGSGLPATTIHLNLPKELRMRVRDEVFRMRRRSEFFPKSRKVVVERNEPVAALGWVRWE